jgi:hypothetical protein
MSRLWAAWARGPVAPAQALRRPLSPWAASLVAVCWIVTAPLVLVVGMLTEILGRALAVAVRVVVGVFALGAVLALLDLFLTHT